jgi:oligoendopeptidase F
MASNRRAGAGRVENLNSAESLLSLLKALAGEPGAKYRYLKFISSGKSKYPVELLKDARVDMATDEPLKLTVRK